MSFPKILASTLGFVFVVIIVTLILTKAQPNQAPVWGGVSLVSPFDEMRFSQFTIDLTSASIPLDQILSGGPGKDGIPALTSPTFVDIQEAKKEGLAGDVTGIFVDSVEGGKFYPYTILVWHEIVNDMVDGVPIAVTFCPLCGSAIVYDRRVGQEVLEFGVSGFLWESNMVMYNRPDQSGNENFWSQSRGDQVVGSAVGAELTHHPMSLLVFDDVVMHHPTAQVLSSDTGFRRDYGFFPYGNYDENEDLLFRTSVDDKRFHPKERFYIVPHHNISLAIHEKSIPLEGTWEFSHGGDTFVLESLADGTLRVLNNGEVLPGYYEMWFSWAIHHQDDGVVWELADTTEA